MDDQEILERFERLERTIEQAQRARTPAERERARDRADDQREDLEQVLRREGYHFTRKELDEMAEEREFQRFKARFDRLAAENLPKPGEEGDEEDEEDEDGDGAKKPPAKRTRKPKPPAGDGDSGSSGGGTGDEEEEWT